MNTLRSKSKYSTFISNPLTDYHLSKLKLKYVHGEISRTDLVGELKEMLRDNFDVLKILKSWDYHKKFGGGPTAGTGFGMA